MGKMKFFPLVLLAVMFLLAGNAFAAGARYAHQQSQPLESTGIFTDRDGNTMDYAVYVYSAGIFADEASSFVGLYDADTTAELIASTLKAKDEFGEATQYDTFTKTYTKPLYFSDGVAGIISTGVAFVEYGPPPAD